MGLNTKVSDKIGRSDSIRKTRKNMISDSNLDVVMMRYNPSLFSDLQITSMISGLPQSRRTLFEASPSLIIFLVGQRQEERFTPANVLAAKSRMIPKENNQ